MTTPANTLDRIYAEAGSFQEYARRYFQYCAELTARFDLAALERFAEILDRARQDGRTVLLAGNGGSAATASHFATDLAYGASIPGAPPLRAGSLTDNVSAVTALGNDRTYADVFVGQLEHWLAPGDVLVVISASGNSLNLVRAVEYANAHGGTTVGLLGFDGGLLKTLCHLAVVVETPSGEYGPVEDLHLMIDHVVTTYLMRRLRAGTARR